MECQVKKQLLTGLLCNVHEKALVRGCCAMERRSSTGKMIVACTTSPSDPFVGLLDGVQQHAVLDSAGHMSMLGINLGPQGQAE